MTDSTLNIHMKSGNSKKETDALARSLSELERQGDGAADSVEEVGEQGKVTASSLGTLKGIVATLFTGAALKGFADVIGEFEQLEYSLGIVFGSMERGKSVFKDIENLALSTPFAVNDLANSVIKLRAAGIEPTTQQMQLFADVSSVTTDSIGSLQAITDLFSRSVAGGLGLEDLNRLADRGIPVFTILQEKLGLARLEVAEFGKSAEGSAEILETLTQALDERFGGAATGAAQLLNNEISNLGIASSRFLKIIGDTGVLATFSIIVHGAADAVNIMSENLDVLGVMLAAITFTAIPALIAVVKVLGAALILNPIGLFITGVVLLGTAVMAFRDEITEVFMVDLPNSFDTAAIHFHGLKATFGIVLNDMLGQIEDFGNSMASGAPEWLKDLFGISNTPFSLQIDIAGSLSKIDALKRGIEDRVADFKQERLFDDIENQFKELDLEGLQSGSLTGNRKGGQPTATEEIEDTSNDPQLMRAIALEEQLDTVHQEAADARLEAEAENARLWGDLWVGTANQVAAGIGDSIATSVLEQKSAAESLKAVMKQVVHSVISGLVQIAIKRAILAVMAASQEKAIVLSGVASAKTLALAYAPAAAAASLASFGGNSGPAMAGMASAYGLSTALAGQAHDGMDEVPVDGSYKLQGGEIVLDKGTSKEVKQQVTRGGGAEGETLQVTFAPVIQAFDPEEVVQNNDSLFRGLREQFINWMNEEGYSFQKRRG